MITIIGKIGCTKCIELKDKLTKEGKEFDYIEFEKMGREQKKHCAYLVRNENNGHFPLVIDEEGVVVQEGLDG